MCLYKGGGKAAVAYLQECGVVSLGQLEKRHYLSRQAALCCGSECLLHPSLPVNYDYEKLLLEA